VLVDHIAILVNKVALGVDSTSLPINQPALLITIQDRIAKRIHFEVAKDRFDVEFSEGEDLRNFLIFQMHLVKDLLTVSIDNVATLVY
jgi:hypothetical protein